MSRPGSWGLLCASCLLLAACEGRITVPVRLCVVSGNAWTAAPPPGPGHFPPINGNFYVEGTQASDDGLNDLLRHVNHDIWIPGANIAFLPVPYPTGQFHYPVIHDPLPPGDFKAHPDQFGPGTYGDLEVFQDAPPTQEVVSAVGECDRAWRRGGHNFAPDAIMVVVAHDFVGPPGVGNPATVGLGPGHDAVLSRNAGTDLCVVPRKLTAADIHDQYAVVVDPALFVSGEPRNVQGSGPNVLAHELGHDLLLAHGDGKDNDQNGVAPSGVGARLFDSDCDRAEYLAFDVGGSDRSLMNATATINTDITPLQRELARTAAVLAPGAFGGPP